MTKVVGEYALLEEIGSGQYGKVYRAQHTVKGDYFAVKCIAIEKYRKLPKLDDFTRNEIEVLSMLIHPNIVRFLEKLQTTNNVYLVYEYCNGGTLEELIYKKGLGIEKALGYFRGLIEGCKAISRHNILHRDIKPSNILLHNDVIKIADFGFCKALIRRNEMTFTMVGSPIYMSPELLKGNEYSEKADVWSLGVMLYEMLFKKCPFEERSIPSLIKVIHTTPLSFPTQIPFQLQELLKFMLQKETVERASWIDLFTFYDRAFDNIGLPRMPNATFPAPVRLFSTLKPMPQPGPRFSKKEISTQPSETKIEFEEVVKLKSEPVINIPEFVQNFKTLVPQGLGKRIFQLASIVREKNEFEAVMIDRFKLNLILRTFKRLHGARLFANTELMILAIMLLKQAKGVVLELNIKTKRMEQQPAPIGTLDSAIIAATINSELERFNLFFSKSVEEFKKATLQILTETENDNERVKLLQAELGSPFSLGKGRMRNTVNSILETIKEALSDDIDKEAQLAYLRLYNSLLDCLLLQEVSSSMYNSTEQVDIEPYQEALETMNTVELQCFAKSKAQALPSN